MPICSISDRFQTDMLFCDMFQIDMFRTHYVTDCYVMSVHHPYCVGGTVVAFIPAVVSGHEHDIAVISNVACC